MTERPEAQPEGKLIEDALKTTGISQREAARRIGLSDARWRQIVSGYQSISGYKAPVRGPAATVARMAHIVGVTPDQLADAGRDDAAAKLRDITEKERETALPPLPPDSQARVDERWLMLEALLQQARVGLSPTEYSTLRSRIDVFFADTPDWDTLSDAPADVPAAEPSPPTR
ncbi:helix-turn-helix domain-containing protein [Actinacidiphila sp. ITFR-21]|uniref:helix-turn-helix domain-containing protein n=1 Tax=Actinacidiphila sp. ITFR-21 TaxID=3075199 RepID=UPI0028891DE2|nr:helix-turn-helix transcriptional regulator [Streptomyces sp. ITFR-21]WNI16436.1 helix-turn-helix transcriptional regulator [Streptomyces sp. ITFR-21]